MSKRFSVVPAVYLVLMDQNKVLLSLRKNTGFADGWYGLVAGHVDGGETMMQAMIREAYEETGMMLSPNDLKMASVTHRRSDDRESADFFFLCKEPPSSFVNKEPEKCSELRFFSIEALPSNTIPYVKEGIMNCLKGVNYSEAGWDQVWTGASSGAD
ncbi:MAG: NUDIX domain-containing protein [Oligoflexales bacterium]|nr:NUDIX domain-containing protein [Oligoflexales bacterium]